MPALLPIEEALPDLLSALNAGPNAVLVAPPGAGKTTRVPLALRNPTNSVAREMGHGKGYVYDHDTPEHFSGLDGLPEELRGTRFYEPGPFGFEKEIAKRLAWWDARRSGG